MVGNTLDRIFGAMSRLNHSPVRPAPWLRRAAPALMLASFVFALALGRRWVQQRQLYRPHDGEPQIWGPDSLRRDSYFAATAAGPRLHGIWWPTPHSRATVLFCHGQRGTLAAMESDLSRLRRRLGVDLFAFDYRGYGASAGVPSEAGLYRDARGAYHHLVEELGVSPHRLVLFGHSLGAAVAIDAALECPAAALIVQSAFTDVRDMARVKFPGWPVHWVARNEFRSIAKVSRLTLPKLFIHGRSDHTVPLPIARRLYEAAAPPKQFLEVPGADHNEIVRRGGLRWAMEVRRFIDEHVGS